MRAAKFALLVVLVAACTSSVSTGQHSSPTARPAGSASPNPKLASGGVVEYAVPNPSPPGTSCAGCGTASLEGMVAGPDGNIWFVDAGLNMVGKITPAGVITQFPVPATGAGSRSITVGPDGNFWIATTLPDSIVRLTPGGVATSFAAAEHSGPESITEGPDGNLWFTEFFAGKLARITPAGVITEFEIPTPDSNPRGIVTGPDGNLWFVESARYHTAVARATTAGVITEFTFGAVPNDLDPTSIIKGPDGNLWVAAGREIEKITLQGEVTTFPLTGEGTPVELAAGPDGNIWFTDGPNNSVGRMSTDGKFREFPLPRDNAQPDGIAAGSDGRMWFTESGVSRIASIGLLVPELKVSSKMLNFGTNAGSQTLVMTNSGDAPLSISAIAVGGADVAAFSASSGCSNVTIAAGAQCRVAIKFQGGKAGPLTAYLKISDNATGSPHVVYLVAMMPGCKLPLAFAATQSSGTPTSAGFGNLQTGDVTTDPTGVFVADSNNLVRSAASPTLRGYLPATFDRAANRWVPAAAELISPDGTRYVYADYIGPYQARLHVVEIATGADRTLATPPGPYGALRFAAEGIYVHTVGEGTGPGVSLVDTATGAIRQLNAKDLVLAVGDGAMWIGKLNPADPHPPVSGMGGPVANELDRRDLTTGATTAWLYQPGAFVWVEAVSHGEVIARADGNDGSTEWVVTGPNQAAAITNPATGESIHEVSGMAVDGDRIWFS
ncbi:MAG TPA: choice-of-anchor D domain-containing protein, partial [Candidatus Dormibacteraeota bacterium]|nr:choice-of-anchor D domain-containing protein [Candidatus Dormibacteraeota bacterium]